MVSAEFDRRVKASFPVGSLVADMGQVLNAQGFWHDWSCSTETEHFAGRDENTWMSKQGAYIQWRADKDGRILEIKGSYVHDYLHSL